MASIKPANRELGVFHANTGVNIDLENGRRIAARKSRTRSKSCFVFSANPIPVEERFQVKVLDTSTFFRSSLAIGFTILNPDTIDIVPANFSKAQDYWSVCDGVVYCNGAKGKLPCSTDLSNGHSVAVRVKQDGFLEYIVNGIVKANIIGNLPKDQPLWGFVELSGYVVAIQSEFYFQFDLGQEVMPEEVQDVTPIQLQILTQQLHTQQQELAIQKQQLQSQQQENRELTSKVERLSADQASLGVNLAVQFQQQLTEELAEQKRVIQEEIQQQLQTLLRQVQSYAQVSSIPVWSIAQDQLQMTTENLGRGAWGEVRVGIYQGTRVAVKKMHDIILSDYNRQLFECEMIVASRVRHPHLVLFIGAVTTGNLTIVSELMETSLRKLLEEEKLKVSDLRPISKDVACALAYLHSLPDPIVHRDVSSANILLNAKQDGWCAKLGDFGSANFLAKLGTVGPGCIAYSAPEAGNPSQQGTKMDVYSFGVLLFEMCVGELVGQRNLELTKSAVKDWGDAEKTSLGQWAVRCTEANPHKRPNMADFIKEI